MPNAPLLIGLTISKSAIVGALLLGFLMNDDSEDSERMMLLLLRSNYRMPEYRKHLNTRIFGAQYSNGLMVQWRSEIWKCPDYKWWKVGQLANGMQKQDIDVHDGIFGSCAQ